MSTTRLKRHHHRHNLRNRFEIIKTLGQGTYGKVKLAVEKSTGNKYAIKSIRKSQIENQQDLCRIRREIEIMASLSHPHIISVHEVFENEQKIILVMDHASGGELYDHINDNQGLYDYEARKYFRQIASAVHYLHQNGIVHRDLKLENIMLDGAGNAVIGDFGLANLHHSKRHLHTFCGSPLYASPEIVNGLPYRGPEVDCWSLGVLLYTLVYGAMPFDGSDFKRLRQQITKGDFYKPTNPSDAAGLIRKLLAVDPEERATIQDICNHWWVNLGFTSTPAQQSPAGRPVNFNMLDFTLNCAPDIDINNIISGRLMSDIQNSNIVADKPLKGILKKPKDFSPRFAKAITDQIGKVAQSRRRGSFDSNASRSNSLEDSESTTTASCDTAELEQEKQPKRGILKNTKHKYKGADSGCVIDDINISDYFSGHSDSIDDSLQSSSDHSGSPCSDGVTRTRLSTGSSVNCDDDDYDLDDIEGVLDALDLEDTEAVCCGGVGSERVRHHHASIVAVEEDLLNEEESENNQNSHETACDNFHNCDCIDHNDDSTTTVSVSSYSSNRPVTSTPTAADSKIKGILKRNSKYGDVDPTWRMSTDSTDSTSSGDVLDISYDSDDDGIHHRVITAWNSSSLPATSEISIRSDEGLGVDDLSSEWFHDHDFSQDDDDFDHTGLFDVGYYEVGIHRNKVSPDLFSIEEAKVVAKQAAEICCAHSMS